MTDEAKALVALQRTAGLKTMPTPLTHDLRIAVSGKGPRAYDWQDKPHRLLYDACTEIETQAREAAAKDAEIARLRKELSDMATKYSCAVDTFNTGFSGYEAVLLHQRRIAHEGPPSNWKDGMKAYAARAALAGTSHDQ